MGLYIGSKCQLYREDKYTDPDKFHSRHNYNHCSVGMFKVIIYWQFQGLLTYIHFKSLHIKPCKIETKQDGPQSILPFNILTIFTFRRQTAETNLDLEYYHPQACLDQTSWSGILTYLESRTIYFLYAYVPGICPPGQGFKDSRSCSECAENTYNNNNGTTCIKCPLGFDTHGLKGATECISKYNH